MTNERRTAVVLLAVLAGLLLVAGTLALGYTTRVCQGNLFDCSLTGLGMVDDHPYEMWGPVAFVLAALAGLGSFITYLSAGSGGSRSKRMTNHWGFRGWRQVGGIGATSSLRFVAFPQVA